MINNTANYYTMLMLIQGLAEVLEEYTEEDKANFNLASLQVYVDISGIGHIITSKQASAETLALMEEGED